ncbi:hypothetical protein Cob_v011114 [Colletotrichum orbiculare MAFF 240422]|uniref:Uncharacterized protein n=1 Tax=Colletotrichum orbiculare (strain 104-T / ATCC 96160 / CBS 514.97 / LARS 414 / MAFF 240422) TaxID=1213857 RepID=N4UUZ9_COLOR|nr:hypothetical protein Cob_v011114 [Colletotrichum orbiculare MAFF 240422]
MRITTALSALSIVSGAFAGCFTSGEESHPTEANIYFHIWRGCQSWFRPDYKPFESRSICLFDRTGQRWDLVVSHEENQDNALVDRHCYYGLAEQAQCKFGGERRVGPFTFRADPQRGDCPEDVPGVQVVDASGEALAEFDEDVVTASSTEEAT